MAPSQGYLQLQHPCLIFCTTTLRQDDSRLVSMIAAQADPNLKPRTNSLSHFHRAHM
eukprot:CAMPEP_0195595972 /NCGR_PEP_ID=MMETSP0815-20121206/2214_1 /TAXON_ID=97485 /ORGANISM="Prymnesium parvum, Strain Texoma1" /LENGTH=56 /DNA_ID=CAMNT_0040735237 /DNA_START=13 /DNA_END=183 /DNA_ORIENTATION=+